MQCSLSYPTSRLRYQMDNIPHKFISHRKQRQRLKALQHYEETGLFKHRNYLNLLEVCLKEHIPTSKEVEFAGYLLDSYGIQNYLDWAYKSGWVKAQIKRVKAKQKEEHKVEYPMLFDITSYKRTDIQQENWGSSKTPLPSLTTKMPFRLRSTLHIAT